MSAGEPASPPVAVLLAHDDLFEGGYVGAVLGTRGVMVVGPFADGRDALRAIEAPGLGAAVITHAPGCHEADALADALERRGIPFLTLAQAADPAAPGGRPILTRPFAAYQVAEWVVQTLART